MTTALRVVPSSTNGQRRPVVLAIPRAEIVEEMMDMQELARLGMFAVGDALLAIERLYQAVQGTSPRIKAIEHAVYAVHDRQEELFNRATMLAGRYDKPDDPA